MSLEAVSSDYVSRAGAAQPRRGRTAHGDFAIESDTTRPWYNIARPCAYLAPVAIGRSPSQPVRARSKDKSIFSLRTALLPCLVPRPRNMPSDLPQVDLSRISTEHEVEILQPALQHGRRAGQPFFRRAAATLPSYPLVVHELQTSADGGEHETLDVEVGVRLPFAGAEALRGDLPSRLVVGRGALEARVQDPGEAEAVEVLDEPVNVPDDFVFDVRDVVPKDCAEAELGVAEDADGAGGAVGVAARSSKEKAMSMMRVLG